MDKEQARIIISLMLKIAKESVSTDTTNADALEFALKAIDMMPTNTTNNNEPIYINYPLITCDDAVSRESVKQIYGYSRLIMKGKLGNIYFLKKLNELPPVTPSRPKGHWIKKYSGYECSECACDSRRKSDFCQYCGAEMVELRESEDKEWT